MLVTVLLWGEVTHAAWLQGRSAAILSAFTLVASNVLAKTLLLSPQFGIGVLDLIYSHCILPCWNNLFYYVYVFIFKKEPQTIPKGLTVEGKQRQTKLQLTAHQGEVSPLPFLLLYNLSVHVYATRRPSSAVISIHYKSHLI